DLTDRHRICCRPVIVIHSEPRLLHYLRRGVGISGYRARAHKKGFSRRYGRRQGEPWPIGGKGSIGLRMVVLVQAFYRFTLIEIATVALRAPSQ
ncbi:MAG: hypothetical protein JXA46_13940, partial [Dehalococcoidales bacterium]|nr:hypothetical protein [Dehalococcoidales bacterium]